MTGPIIIFRESISNLSPTTVAVKTPNNLNHLCVMVEPLEKRIIKAIETRRLGDHIDETELLKGLQYYGWNKEDSSNLWAFGPVNAGMNVLINKAVNSSYVQEIQDYVVQGFRWSVGEGPLCGEPYYGLKFSLVECHLHDNASHRGVSQIQGAIRRACHGALLSSRPILLEAIYKIQIIVPEKYVRSVYKVFLKGRRKLLTAKTTEDSKITVVSGEVPITESIGITNEIRMHSAEKATLFKRFSHYDRVPGDPMYKDGGLARYYVEQIRKRKRMNHEYPPDPTDFMGQN